MLLETGCVFHFTTCHIHGLEHQGNARCGRNYLWQLIQLLLKMGFKSTPGITNKTYFKEQAVDDVFHEKQILSIDSGSDRSLSVLYQQQRFVFKKQSRFSNDNLKKQEKIS